MRARVRILYRPRYLCIEVRLILKDGGCRPDDVLATPGRSQRPAKVPTPASQRTPRGKMSGGETRPEPVSYGPLPPARAVEDIFMSPLRARRLPPPERSFSTGRQLRLSS